MALASANVREIFVAAVEITSAAERSRFLDHACAGDKELRTRVDALIAAHEAPQGVLDRAAAAVAEIVYDDAALDGHGSTELGSQIGPYQLLEQIGEGGFGVVFLAEQQHPVRRQVALKVIKPGMDSRQVIARFEAERQALALMDHPHIAKVLDAGTVGNPVGQAFQSDGASQARKPDLQTGRPYFVMELVRGVPITQYSDQSQLTLRQRLELFISVCHAVQHAHQKGIIHRDIKPSNVLVTVQDDAPVVKVIDFGIAKAIGGQLADVTQITQFAQLIGTPLYMSPEQAEMGGVDIDTRSDIYSLGVLLYELLTGTTPFDRERLRAAGCDEVRRIIREEDPPRPSSRISTLGRAGETVSVNRQSDPNKLGRLFRGDLDWIVMRALEKDRQRRYETAAGLARDVERYLHDEPVEACPPTALYRFGKFARRNRGTFLTVTLVAVALVLGAAVSAWQAVRATRAEQLAEQRLEAEKHERARAEANLAEAQRQRGLAEQSFRQARVAIDQLFVKLTEDTALNEPELGPLRNGLLKSALEYYQNFIELWKDDPKKVAELAESYRRVGLLMDNIGVTDQSVVAFEKALGLQRQLSKDRSDDPLRQQGLVETLSQLAYEQQSVGAYEEARKGHEQAISLWQKLLEQNPDEPKLRDGLARANNNLGWTLYYLGRKDEPLPYHRLACEIRERLVQDFPASTEYKWALSRAYLGLINGLTDAGQSAETLALNRRRLALITELIEQHGPRTTWRTELAHVHNSIGDSYRNDRRADDKEWITKALESYAQAQQIQEELLREHPTLAAIESNLMNTLVNIGQVLKNSGKQEEAIGYYDRAIERAEKCIQRNPRDVGSLNRIAVALTEKALIFERLGQIDEAVSACEKAVAAEEQALAIAPSAAHYRRELQRFRDQLARVLFKLGNEQRPAGRQQAARQNFERAIALWQSLVEQNPSEPQYLKRLAGVYQSTGALHGELQDHVAAVRFCQMALAVWEQLVRDNPDDVGAQAGLMRAHGSLATRLGTAGQCDAALEHYHQKLALVEELIERYGTKQSYERDLGETYNGIADIYRQERGTRPDWAERAVAAYLKAQAVQEPLVQKYPADNRLQSGLANTLSNLGVTQSHTKDHEAALRSLDQAIALFNRLVSLNPSSLFDLSSLAHAHCLRGRALAALGRHDESVAAFESGVDHYQRLVENAPDSARYRNELAVFTDELARARERLETK